MTWDLGTWQQRMEVAHAALDRDAWQAVIDALDGDDSKRDQAFDVLNLAAPLTWLEEQP